MTRHLSAGVQRVVKQVDGHARFKSTWRPVLRLGHSIAWKGTYLNESEHGARLDAFKVRVVVRAWLKGARP